MVWKLFLSLMLVVSPCAAQSFDGLPLPPVIDQETYDLIIGSDPTDPVYGCFPHYYHCALENSLLKGLGDGRTPSYQPAEPTDADFSCTRTLDWDRGDLWKPVSDRGKPVVLLPCGYNAARAVVVYSGDKTTRLATGNSRNYCKNGDRSHFDITEKASDLPKDSILVVLMSDGSVECRNLPDPTRRYE